MITLLTVKMADKSKAKAKMAIELANAHKLGWSVFSRREYEQNGQYVIVVWITPLEKDE